MIDDPIASYRFCSQYPRTFLRDFVALKTLMDTALAVAYSMIIKAATEKVNGQAAKEG